MWGADPLPSSPNPTDRPFLFENAFPKPSGALFADDSNSPVKGPLRASQTERSSFITTNEPNGRLSPLNSPPSRQPADVDLPADWGMPRCPPNFGASEKAAPSRPAGLAFRQQDNSDNRQISFSSKRQQDIAY